MNRKIDYLSAKQVSTYLGIPLRTIHRLSKQGRIKSIKIGGRWYYQKTVIEQYQLLGTNLRDLPITRNQNPPETRSYPRMNCYLRCTYTSDLPFASETAKGVIRNISGSGFFMTGNGLQIDLEDPVKVIFELEGKLIETKGRVVRKTGDGYGVKIRNISPEGRGKIIAYIG